MLGPTWGRCKRAEKPAVINPTRLEPCIRLGRPSSNLNQNGSAHEWKMHCAHIDHFKDAWPASHEPEQFTTSYQQCSEVRMFKKDPKMGRSGFRIYRVRYMGHSSCVNQRARFPDPRSKVAAHTRTPSRRLGA